MNEVAQKQFLDARHRYNTSVEAWHKLGNKIVAVAEALANPRYGNQRGGWYHMSVVGHAPSGRSNTSYGSSPTLTPDQWPTGAQIAEAWIECNDAFRDLSDAYRALPTEDRKYLQVGEPQVQTS
jgi:hypothetical protein